MRARSLALLVSVTSVVAVGCKKDPLPIAEQEPPHATPPAKAPEIGESSFAVRADGKVAVYIDAPLEKFKGETKRVGGFLRVNPQHLDLATGTITASLIDFTTHTFEDADKNATQTEHARNWFELGDDVKSGRPKDYENYKDATFKIDGVESVSPGVDLTVVPEDHGVRKVTLKVKGTLWVHSRPAPKAVTIEASFKGPADAPTELAFKLVEPMHVSLSAHDVKPRDATGKFLDGALKVVGKKLDDDAQLSIEGSATRDASTSAAPSASASP